MFCDRMCCIINIQYVHKNNQDRKNASGNSINVYHLSDSCCARGVAFDVTAGKDGTNLRKGKNWQLKPDSGAIRFP